MKNVLKKISFFLHEKKKLFYKASIKTLNTKLFELNKNAIKPIPLESLTPIGNADEDEIYSGALLSALNDDDIYNIGITGGYGSGKSSILKSFENKHRDEFKILNISLATFTNTKEPDGTNDQLLEYSILQQLIYQVKIKRLPDSRFRRIKKNNWKRIFFIDSFAYFIWLCSIPLTFEPNFLKHTKLWKGLDWMENGNWISLISFIILSFGIIVILYKLIRIFKNSKLSRFNLKDGEIEIDKDIDKSILNKYIDEILYFFEATNYDIVVIEDLDRFDNKMIFSKLREINNMLRNSEQINKIVFIYAVRDDLFKDTQRTKFFDLIIPVIPIINTSNSGDMLLQRIRYNTDYNNISKSFISDISLFIDDMRLLKNIFNEFTIYDKKIGKNLNKNKLLAIIIHKNLYPDDFVKLHNETSVINNVFKKKYDFIRTLKTELSNEINSLKNLIKEGENELLNSKQELISVYVSSLLKENIFSSNVTINNKTYHYNQLFNEDVFDLYLEYGITNFISGNQWINFNNKDIRKEDFQNRIKKIENKNKIKRFEEEIQQNNKKLSNLDSLSFSEIIELNDSWADELMKDEIVKYDLTIYLIRNCFIEEDYDEYISFFHVGSLTKEDKNFLISVKKRESLDFTYKLTNLEKIVSKLNLSEFKYLEVLNIDLVNYLVEYKEQYPKQINNVLNQSKNNLEEFTGFFDRFIEQTTMINNFLPLCAKYWKGLWIYIKTESSITEDTKDNLLKSIICHLSLQELKELNSDQVLQKSIENKISIFAQLNDSELKTFFKLIDEIDFKFQIKGDIDFNLPLYKYIYEVNKYRLSFDSISSILNFYDKSINEEEILTENFTAIINSKCENLKNFILQSTNEYVENIYLKLNHNQKESSEAFVKLLNFKELDDVKKEKIILKAETLIKDVSKISNLKLWNLLFSKSLVEANWSNVLHHYHEYEIISDELTTYLNLHSNYEELSKEALKDSETFSSDLVVSLSRSIILHKDLSEESFEKLVNSISYEFVSSDFDDVSEKRMKKIIDNEIISFNADNILYLKDSYTNLHLHMLEQNTVSLIEEIEDLSEFHVDSSDLQFLLESNKFKLDQKISIISVIENDFIEGQKSLIKAIGNVLFEQKFIDAFIYTNFLCSVLQEIEDLNIKVNIIINRLNGEHISKPEISQLLQSCGKPISKLAEKGIRPKLKMNPTNKRLGESLKKVGYISSFTVNSLINKISYNTKRK